MEIQEVYNKLKIKIFAENICYMRNVVIWKKIDNKSAARWENVCLHYVDKAHNHIQMYGIDTT